MRRALTVCSWISEIFAALLTCVETHGGRKTFLYVQTYRQDMAEKHESDDDDRAKIIKEIKFEDSLNATAPTLDMNSFLSCVEFVFHSRATRVFEIAKGWIALKVLQTIPHSWSWNLALSTNLKDIQDFCKTQPTALETTAFWSLNSFN